MAFDDVKAGLDDVIRKNAPAAPRKWGDVMKDDTE